MKTKQQMIEDSKKRLKNNYKGLLEEYERDAKYMNPDYPVLSLRGGDYTPEARDLAIAEFERLGWKCNYTGYWLRLV